MRGERIQIQKWAIIGPPAKLHLMALVALESISVKSSMNFRGIAMGLYRGWRVEGSVPQSSLASLDPSMHEDYAFVCVC